MQNNRRKVHEKYHYNTRAQKAVIKIDNFTYTHIAPVLQKYLRPNMKILDVGCGSGTLAFYCASEGAYVTGVDISKKAIQSCLKTKTILRLKNIEFSNVNFPDEKINGRFDLIIFSEVIEHLEKDDLALKKLYKLLNPGAKLLITTPSINAPLHRWGMAKSFDKNVGHLRRYDVNELKKMLSRNRFKVLETKIVEGPLRNFLFVNKQAGKMVRFLKFFIATIFTQFDNLSSSVFGGADIIIVARRGK